MYNSFYMYTCILYPTSWGMSRPEQIQTQQNRTNSHPTIEILQLDPFHPIRVFYYIPDPANPVVSLYFPSAIALQGWQGPQTFTLGIACSHDYAITSVGDLTVTFTNMREKPVSDLPSITSIPETHLSTDPDFHCVSLATTYKYGFVIYQ